MNYSEIVRAEDSKLLQFYDILVEVFPDPYGREDVNILRYNLSEGSWEEGDEVCRYHIIIAQVDQRVIGGSSFYFYKNRDISLGMGAYLAVKRDFWGNGIGSKLIAIRDEIITKDAGKINCHPQCLIIQVSDPNLMSKEEIRRDPMDPWKREKFWRNRGYRKIAFNFIQPSIRLGEPPVEYLSLYMFPYCEQLKNMEAISRTDLWNIINCFVRCIDTLGPVEEDPSYLRMKAEVTSHKSFRLDS